MINIGIIGIGYWGEKLVRNFKKLDNVNIKYLCDLKFSEGEGIQDYKEILRDSSIDAVVVATQIPDHYQIVKDSLLSGKNVFCEKMVTSRAEEAKELINLAKEKELILFIDYTFLYSSELREIKKIIDSGKIGKICSVRADRLNYGKFQKDNNVIADLLPHDASILYYLLEDSVKEVLVLASKNLQNDSEDFASLLIKYNLGATANINLSWINYEKERKYQIGGTKGMIIWDDIKTENKIKIIDSSGQSSFPEVESKIEPLHEVCRDFIGKCENRTYWSENNKISLEIAKICGLIDNNSLAKKNILVTGGAGYIGSVAVKELVKAGYAVTVVDSLFRGDSLLEYIKSVAKFYKIDIAKEKEKLEEMFKENNFDAVMHFAAYKSVEESMENPDKYKDNVTGTENILELMARYNVGRIIFSSSAAVYKPADHPLREEDQVGPANIYGETKLECEEKIRDFCQEHKIIYANLRYFNVAGDGGLNYIDPMPENVLPIIMETLTGKRKEFVIFGNDYDSRDGSCLRDYIHVSDLVKAHILALSTLKSMTINLGTSRGYTVLELVKITEEVTGQKLNYKIGPRRAGDPAGLIASYEKAKQIMGWEPQKDVKEMIESASKVYKNLNKKKAVIWIMGARPCLKLALELLYKNFNNKYNYPVLVTTFGRQYSRNFIEKIHQEISPNIKFIELPKLKKPSHIKEEDMFYNRKEIEYVRDSFPKSRIGFLHTNQFVTGLVTEYPEIMKYDYVLKMDDDHFFIKELNFDLFKFMEDNKKLFGVFSLEKNDSPRQRDCQIGLRDLLKKYIKDNNIQPQSEFLDKKGNWDSRISQDPTIWNMSVFKNKNWEEWWSYVNQSGGIYKYRWGDLEIHALYMRMFYPDSAWHDFDFYNKKMIDHGGHGVVHYNMILRKLQLLKRIIFKKKYEK